MAAWLGAGVGPLASANASWVAMARARVVGMERLMAVMVRGMAIKMVVFGAYVAGVLTLMDVRPIPFVASFTTGFIGLYAMEAYFLKRLIETPVPQPAI